MCSEARAELRISSLGGSGENGRNCHVIGWNDSLFLLDCGVCRKTAGNEIGSYPALTEALVSRIQAVFLSHCHEDHAAALPLLYRLGYRGAVYAAPETVRETPAFIRKWMQYVRERGGKLPYDETDCEKIRFQPMRIGAQTVEGIPVLTGRGGHVCGSLWFCLTMDEKRILYTGDLCLKPLLLAADPVPACDVLIADCAYAGRTFSGEEQLRELLQTAEETVQRGGCVLLPVPAKGRSADLLSVFGSSGIRNIWADQAVADSLCALKTEHAWVQQRSDECCYAVLPDEAEAQNEIIRKGGVLLVTDGMLTTASAVRWLDAVKADPRNCIVITGHAAEGTPAAEVFHREYRMEHGILAEAKRITIKVHPDEGDLCRLAEQSGAKTVMLFHGEKPITEDTELRLRNNGITVSTVCYPVWIE